MAENERQDEGERTGLSLDAEGLADAPRGYANNVRVTFTPEDFTLFFGWYSLPPLEARPESGEIRSTIQPVMQVTLPLNIMRSVIAVMTRQLEGYESNFGPIPVHPARPAWMIEEEMADDA
ncbi:MAG: DUF3467 domain-containing protein [Gaiellaceae bacterium]